ncbi:dynamin family protein [Brachyspira pulli]|uniref:dynamin family protein n=1 Tax=Brachyspira pulli TaxID=310721 RepID=UPI003003FC8B
MLEKQIDYCNFLNDIKKYISDVKTINIEDFKLNETIKTIKETELVVPVIGAFSAGKSSLLNSFLGKSYLSVAVTPETALATELRYNSSEYIEAIKNDGSSEKFQIEDVQKIKDRASEFKYAKYYINNTTLKNIEPLILVDMPGFESPLDLHNKAILEYIERGVYFIVLQSVEDGNITKSMIRELENINTFGRKFSFFLSKTNLKPQSQVNEIANLVKEQLNDYFDMDSDITLVDNNGGNSLNAIILTINPDGLIEDLYLSNLKDLFLDIKQTINTSISALNNDKEKNNDIIKELKKSIENLERERDSMISDVQNRYGSRSVNNIVEEVGRMLSNNIQELAQAYKVGGQGYLTTTINEMVKNSLSNSIQNAMLDINKEIVTSFTIQLNSIDNAISNTMLSEDAIKNISQNVNDLYKDAGKILFDLRRWGNTGISAVLGSVIGFTVPVVGPIVGIIVALMPNILSSLFGVSQQNQEAQQFEQIKKAILTQVIPQVKREIRNKIPVIFNEQIQNMIKSISDNFKEKISQQVNALEATQEEMNAKKIDIEATIAKYKNIIEKISALANKVLYKG